jgi:hypothetical protein
MAAIDTWVLDGIDLTATNFSMMEFTADPPEAKPEWLTGADSEWEALAREPKHMNRLITMRLRVRPQASMNAALDQVGSIVDKFRAASRDNDGIELVWTPANSTRTVTFDVLQGEIKELPISMEGQGRSWLMQRPIITVEMKAKPYYRYPETLTTNAAAATPIVTQEITGVTGDVPALGRLIVTDNAAQGRKEAEWGLEGRTYNAATSLIIDSDSMVVANYAGSQTTRTGAYDPNASGNNVIRASVVLNDPVPICNTGVLAHVGSFRVWVRMWPSRTTHNVRLKWRVADGEYTQNPWAGLPMFPAGIESPVWTGQWVELDLGIITIPTVTAGTQGWDGIVEAFENASPLSSSGTVDIDYLLLVPVDEGYGRAVASYSFSRGVTAGYDQFTGTTNGSNLNARTAPLGGSWATSGATNDFTFADPSGSIVSETIARSTTSDSTYRYAILGTTNYSRVAVSSDFLVENTTIASGVVYQGVTARWTDASNWFGATMIRSTTVNEFALLKTLAGSQTTVKSTPVASPPGDGEWFQIQLVVLTNGRVWARLGMVQSTMVWWIAELQMFDSDLASGTLATGKPGVHEANTGTTAGFRLADNIVVSQPTDDSFLVASGEAIHFRHDKVIREGAGGSAYFGQSVDYRGTRFLVPPGTSRVAVKARRQDQRLQAMDNVTDSTAIQVGITSRGLVVPR